MGASKQITETDFTCKEEAFVREYLIDFNASQAAKRAGYSAKDWRSLGVLAYRLLKKDKIRSRIREEIEKRNERTEVKQDEIIRGLLDAVDKAYSMKQPMAAVRAYEVLAKHVGMLEDKHKVELEGKVSFGDVIKKALEGGK